MERYKYLGTLEASSCLAASTDLPDPLSPTIFTVHCSREVFKALSCIGTELLYIGSSWLSCLCLSMRILEADTVKYEEMKEKIKKEYIRKTRKLFETKLHRRNVIKGIKTWALPLVRYSGPILKWTREELQQIDRRTRNLMTTHKALHPRDDVDRLYIQKKKKKRRRKMSCHQ